MDLTTASQHSSLVSKSSTHPILSFPTPSRSLSTKTCPAKEQQRQQAVQERAEIGRAHV